MPKKFMKARPDRFRCVPIPEWAYEALGGIEKKPQYPLLLSAMMGGAVVTEKKYVDTPRGTVEVDLGQVWTSHETMIEDVHASAGTAFTRNQATYAVNKYADLGMVIASNVVHPETRGHYGKIYTLNPALLSPDQPHVDVVKGYKLFYYGDPKTFNLGEIAVAKIGLVDYRTDGYIGPIPDGEDPARYINSGRARRFFKRGRYGVVENWINQVAEKGMENEAFTSIGRWRQGETGDPKAPVFVPYVPIDLDREQEGHYQAFLDAREVASQIEDRGYDMDRVFVSDTTNKGFHIQISSDQVGCPIYSDAKAAAEMLAYVAADVTKGIKTDSAVESVHSLFRITGSKHAMTGRFKTTWTAADFLTLEYDDVLLASMRHQPFLFPPSVTDDHVDEVFAAFIEMSDNASMSLYEKIQRQRRAGNRPGEKINHIVQGVANHGDDVVAGRNRSAYTLACWLLEEKKTNDEEIDAAYAAGGVSQAIAVWNRRNSPHLTASEQRGAISAASKKVL